MGADSMQLYAGLTVLTAGPAAAETARSPHHLFGSVDPADGWSTGRWLRAAGDAISDIAARSRDVIVVGGTGLYFRALTLGLADIPPVPPFVRRAAETDYARLGEATFRDRLAKADPQAANRIAPGDRQRLVRAWEVYSTTGKALSEWHMEGEPLLAPDSWTAVALEPPREALYARCDARLTAMAQAGALEEVAALMARELDPELPAMKAVGVRDFAAHLTGEVSLEAAIAAAQQETRHYAKRQMTWMRGQMADWPRITGLDPGDQWRQFLALNPALTP